MIKRMALNVFIRTANRVSPQIMQEGVVKMLCEETHPMVMKNLLNAGNTRIDVVEIVRDLGIEIMEKMKTMEWQAFTQWVEDQFNNTKLETEGATENKRIRKTMFRALHKTLETPIQGAQYTLEILEQFATDVMIEAYKGA